MTTLTAVPNYDTGTMTVTIVKTEAITSLIRADSNGTRKVRTMAGVFPSAGTSGTLTITDHEAALTGPVSYRAGTAAPVYTSFAKPLPPRLTLPVQPSVAVWVNNLHAYDAARETSGTVHDIIGRDFPIVVRGSLRSRRGKLEAIAETLAEARLIDALLDRGQTVHLRESDNPGMDMYFYATRSSVEPVEDKWRVSAEYVETGWPADDRLAYGSWTFTTLAAVAGATFTTTAQDYESFTALAVGEK